MVPIMHAAFPRWIAMLNFWRKKEVERGSSIAAYRDAGPPSSRINLSASGPHGRLERDRGEKISITQTGIYLSLFSLSSGAWGASLRGCASDVGPSNSVDAGKVHSDQASSLLLRDYGCSVWALPVVTTHSHGRDGTPCRSARCTMNYLVGFWVASMFADVSVAVETKDIRYYKDCHLSYLPIQKFGHEFICTLMTRSWYQAIRNTKETRRKNGTS